MKDWPEKTTPISSRMKATNADGKKSLQIHFPSARSETALVKNVATSTNILPTGK
jgi:hypothetical protein